MVSDTLWRMLPLDVQQAFATAPGQVLTTGDLGRLGYHRTQVAAWAAEGDLDRLLHGLYRDPTAVAPEDQGFHAALRYLRRRANSTLEEPAIIGGPGALALERTVGFDLSCPPLVLVDLRSRVRTDTDLFTSRRVDLSRVPHHHIRGMPVTFSDRSLADSALNPTLAEAVLRNAVDDLRYRRMLWLPDAVETWQMVGHEGSRRLLAMWERGDFDQESDAERRAFQQLFVDHPPEPDCQVVVHGNLRVDFVFLNAMLIVEYHGNPHDGKVDQDATRNYALERLGYRIIVVTKSMMRDPGALATHIHEVRIQREQLVRAGVIRRATLPLQPPRRLPLRTLEPAG